MTHQQNMDDSSGGDLQVLLRSLRESRDVEGALIVVHDGTVLISDGFDAAEVDKIGIWALGVYMHSEHVTKKMGHDRVPQIMSVTEEGVMIIADFGGGLLVTISPRCPQPVNCLAPEQ